MKIFELFEQTVAPVAPGQGQKLPPTSPTENPPATSNTPQTPAPTGAPPSTVAGQTTTTPNPNTPQVGKPMGSGSTNPQQTQQLQQATKDTMTDLDKIAAQIVGLKQKQQQMQQQMQQVSS